MDDLDKQLADLQASLDSQLQQVQAEIDGALGIGNISCSKATNKVQIESDCAVGMENSSSYEGTSKMKKVTLTIQALQNRLEMCKITLDDLFSYLAGKVDFKTAKYLDCICGYTLPQTFKVTAEIDGKEAYSGTLNVEDYFNSWTSDVNSLDMIAETDSAKLSVKRIKEEVGGDSKISWKGGPCDLQEVLKEIYGFESQVKKIYGEEDLIHVAINEIKDEEVAYTYEFHIPQGEDLDVNQINFIVDRDQFFEEYECMIIPTTIIYKKNILVEYSSIKKYSIGEPDYKAGTINIVSRYDSYFYLNPINYVHHCGSAIENFSFALLTSLKETIIPDNVTIIGYGAFCGCVTLEKVAIPKSVKSIEGYAFSNCESLREIIIPDSVTTIGEYAFSGCESLEKVVIPDSVTTIGEFAFSGCKSLEKVVIPDSVIAIEDRTFSHCHLLREINIPNSVTTIGLGAFEDTSLREINIPNSVTTIEISAFQDTSLREIILPDSVTTIRNLTFCNCESLEKIILPDSITTIEERAFLGCVSLKEIIIPDSVNTIGNEAFRNCTSLEKVIIPESTSMGENVFEGCDAQVIIKK